MGCHDHSERQADGECTTCGAPCCWACLVTVGPSAGHCAVCSRFVLRRPAPRDTRNAGDRADDLIATMFTAPDLAYPRGTTRAIVDGRVVDVTPRDAQSLRARAAGVRRRLVPDIDPLWPALTV